MRSAVRAVNGVRSARGRGFTTNVACAVAFALCMGCRRDAPYTVAVVLDAAGIEGAQLAASRINAMGGIHGHPLELQLVRGAERSARVSLATAERLASDESVLAVVGHTNSASSLSASQVYNARGLVQLSPTTTSPLYSEAGLYSFRMVPSDIHQGAFLAEAALRSGTRPRVAVAYVNSDYGRPLHGIVVERLRNAGAVAVGDVPFDAIDSAAATVLVGSLVRSNPQVLIWIGRSADLLPIAATLRRALPHLTVIASDAFSRRLPTDETRHVFDGIRYVRFVDVTRKDSVLQNLRAAYTYTHGSEISDQALLSYDAVTLLGEAIADDPKRESIRAWLSGVGRDGKTFHGVTGPVTFATSRDRAPDYVLVDAGR